MIFEEVIIMNPEKTVTCLILEHHSILTSNHMKKKRMREMLKDTMTYNTPKPVQFGINLFFAISFAVHFNSHNENFNVSSKIIILQTFHYHHPTEKFSISIINNMII